MSRWLFLVSLVGTMVSMIRGSTVGGTVFLVELLRAVRSLEFMAFAGNTGQGHGKDEQGEKFHRGAS